MPTDLELKEWIVNQLSSGRDPDDLILSICEITGKPWKEAAALVQATQEHRSDEIVRRQSPILTVMAFSTFLGGVIILGYVAYALVGLLAWYQAGSPPADAPSFANDSARIFLRYLPVGLGMVVGSLLGMRDVWSAFLFPNRSTH
jgi:hypothetical protein